MVSKSRARWSAIRLPMAWAGSTAGRPRRQALSIGRARWWRPPTNSVEISVDLQACAVLRAWRAEWPAGALRCEFVFAGSHRLAVLHVTSHAAKRSRCKEDVARWPHALRPGVLAVRLPSCRLQGTAVWGGRRPRNEYLQSAANRVVADAAALALRPSWGPSEAICEHSHIHRPRAGKLRRLRAIRK